MWFGQFWSRRYIERERIESKNWMNQSKNVERTLIKVLLIGKSSGFALEFGKCWKSSKRKTFWTSFVILPLVISIIHISMLFFEMICILNDYNDFLFFVHLFTPDLSFLPLWTHISSILQPIFLEFSGVLVTSIMTTPWKNQVNQC